jgi:hypothetical protein
MFGAFIIPFLAAFLVILHHRVKHRHDLRGWRRWFQIKDADNHETVALTLMGVGIGMVLASYI